MRYQFSILGNRVCIKTLKEKYNRTVYFTFEEASKVLLNIKKNGWTVEFKEDYLENILLS